MYMYMYVFLPVSLRSSGSRLIFLPNILPSFLPSTFHQNRSVVLLHVHMHHTNVCSVLHMLIVCLDHASSLHTCTVLVYHTYMYTHSIYTMSVCGPPCAIVCSLLQNGKWLLGASVSLSHSEALLRAMSAISVVTSR